MSKENGLPWIVSVDDHVVEPPHVWQSRLPTKWRDEGPRVVRDRMTTTFVGDDIVFERGGDGREVDFWVYEDEAYPTPQILACAAFRPDELTIEPINFDEMRPGCYDVKARLADMDMNHTEMSLCFPTYTRFCGQRFLKRKNVELAMACVKAYNDWMIEEWSAESGGRLIPLCLIPLWDPAVAAAEVRRNAERGCRAVSFSEQPTALGLPSLHAGYWDPFLDACNETSTVINMHIGSSSRILTSASDAPGGVGIASSFAQSGISLIDWLFSGKLAEFPDLKLAYSEAQIGWVPYVLERADYVWEHGRQWNGIPETVANLPSSYYSGRVYGCFFSDDHGLRSRDAIGVDQIVFEIDYPHQDSTWPNSRAVIEKFKSELTDEELYKIVRGNALQMLGIADPQRSPTP